MGAIHGAGSPVKNAARSPGPGEGGLPLPGAGAIVEDATRAPGMGGKAPRNSGAPNSQDWAEQRESQWRMACLLIAFPLKGRMYIQGRCRGVGFRAARRACL